MKKIVTATVTGVLMGIAGMTDAREVGTQNSADHSAVDLRFGVTPFLGVLSAEYQAGHYGIGIGFPGQLAVSYYRDPGRDSFFYSVAIASYQNDSFDDYEEGYHFQRRNTEAATLGGGYRWLWSSGWNVTTSAGLQYNKSHYKNDRFARVSSMEKETTGLVMGIALGYAF